MRARCSAAGLGSASDTDQTPAGHLFRHPASKRCCDLTILPDPFIPRTLDHANTGSVNLPLASPAVLPLTLSYVVRLFANIDKGRKRCLSE
jgi:hypothetical protein